MGSGNCRIGPKETNMSQICVNQPVVQRPVLSASGPWTRFVRAIDNRLESVADALLTWQRRHRDRMHLQSLDDRILRDIGISYVDVHREASKPFWRS
jgi:uncharacterized protein YjiS (DUF1127 family)